jgi:DNA polymerase-3 subunit epsilon
MTLWTRWNPDTDPPDFYPTFAPTDLILDTETTGLGRENADDVIELAIVDGSGAVLFDERFRPVVKHQWPEAEAIHGIRPQDVWGLGTLGAAWPRILALLEGRNVWVYNKGFDIDLMAGTLHRSLGKPAADDSRRLSDGWECAMHAYAAHAGVPGRYEGEWKWHKLVNAGLQLGIDTSDLRAHSAVGDALLTQRVLAAMRDTPKLLEAGP